jgi:hypothetical protein
LLCQEWDVIAEEEQVYWKVISLKSGFRTSIAIFFVLFPPKKIGAGFDEKERKNQDLPKLLPHTAKRSPAATSAHRALKNRLCRQKLV